MSEPYLVQKYFTIEPAKGAGIGDFLRNQFCVLRCLGESLGYTYVHTPIRFERSTSTLAQRLSRKIWIQLFLRLGLAPRRVVKVRLWIAKRNAKQSTSAWDGALSQFLGLDTITPTIRDELYRKMASTDVVVRDLFARNVQVSSGMLREQIECGLEHKASPILFRFRIGRQYHRVLPEIQDYLKKEFPGGLETMQLSLRERFWDRQTVGSVPSRSQDHRLKIVIHLRLGDRAVINLADRQLFLHGNHVFSGAESFRSHMIGIKPPPIFTGFRDAVMALRCLSTNFGSDCYTCTVLTDGHERTLSTIIDAVSAGKVSFNPMEVRHIKNTVTIWKKEMHQILALRNVSLIAGESISNTQSSILALAQANVVLYGSGGFGRGIHRLYRRNADSLLLNLAEFDESAICAIGKRLECRGQRS